MICPVDQQQMHQATTEIDGKISYHGGGMTDENKYITWMIQECPACGRRVKETYSCEVINLNNNDK